jgi:hypothetical protein
VAPAACGLIFVSLNEGGACRKKGLPEPQIFVSLNGGDVCSKKGLPEPQRPLGLWSSGRPFLLQTPPPFKLTKIKPYPAGATVFVVQTVTLTILNSLFLGPSTKSPSINHFHFCILMLFSSKHKWAKPGHSVTHRRSATAPEPSCNKVCRWRIPRLHLSSTILLRISYPPLSFYLSPPSKMLTYFRN